MPVAGVNNPFDFSASDITPEIYACREPFIDVVRRVDLKNVEEYKLHASGMNEEVMKVLVGMSSSSSICVELISDDFHTEGHLRPFHVQLMAAPILFAGLTRAEWHKLVELWKVPKKEVKSFARRCLKGDPSPEKGEKNKRGMSLEYTLPEKSPTESGGTSSSEESDCSGVTCQHEAATEDSRGKLDKFRGDMFLFNKVVDKHGEETKVLQASVECKEKGSSLYTALFQAATSSRVGIIRNVSLGHGQPVHMISLSQSQWLGGVLVLKGVVRLSCSRGDSIITDRDYEEYEKTFAITGYQPPSTRGNKRISQKEQLREKNQRKEDLRQRLRLGLDRLRNMCSLDPSIIFPNGEYIVGTLYLPEEDKAFRNRLPSSEHGSLDSDGARHLLAGLMRIICGESVRSWNRDRIILARTLRLEYSYAVGKIGKVDLDINSEMVLHHLNFKRCREDWLSQMRMMSEEVQILDMGRREALKSLASDQERRFVSVHCFAETMASALKFLDSAKDLGADVGQVWGEFLHRFPREVEPWHLQDPEQELQQELRPREARVLEIAESPLQMVEARKRSSQDEDEDVGRVYKRSRM